MNLQNRVNSPNFCTYVLDEWTLNRALPRNEGMKLLFLIHPVLTAVEYFPPALGVPNSPCAWWSDLSRSNARAVKNLARLLCRLSIGIPMK